MTRPILLFALAAALPVAVDGEEAPSKAGLRALGNAFAGVYEKVAPTVVVLEVAKQESAGGQGGLDWNRFLRDPRASRPPVEESEGSGFIIRGDGYILTNAHVIEGADPRRGVIARRQDGTRMPLTIVGVDEKTDLAVLKAEAGGLPAVQWGDSASARVGEFVCAIGAPYELDFTLTAGVISAKGRSNLGTAVYEDYLQTDTSINPGNSGGPLCDLDGRVIGVNTLINGISRGLSFAIPSSIAKAVSDELIASGRVVRPWLGIRIETLGDDPALQKMMGLERGVLVRTIEPDAPASRSELRPADVIVEIDGEPVSSALDLQQTVLRKRIGQEVRLKVWRRGMGDDPYISIPVTTAELPGSPALAADSEAPRKEPLQQAQPADFGLEFSDLSGEVAKELGVSTGGVIVTDVAPGSAAELAGLRCRDVITAAGSDEVRDAASFRAILDEFDDGDEAVLLVERGGKKTYAILKR